MTQKIKYVVLSIGKKTVNRDKMEGASSISTEGISEVLPAMAKRTNQLVNIVARLGRGAREDKVPWRSCGRNFSGRLHKPVNIHRPFLPSKSYKPLNESISS